MKFGTCISVVALMTAFSAVDANAAVDVTIKEVGSDVVMTTAGSINRSGLTPFLSCNFFARDRAYLKGSPAYLSGGYDSKDACAYEGFTGPAQFSTSTLETTTTHMSQSVGDYFALMVGGYGSGGSLGGNQLVYLGNSYVFGTPLANSTTFKGHTLSSMGLVAGTFVYTSIADSITVTIQGRSGAVPEPATWAMMIAGFGALGGMMRQRRLRTVAA